MIDFVNWALTAPAPLILSGWFIGLATGLIIGRGVSTAAIEQQRDKALRDVQALRRSFALLSRADVDNHRQTH